MHHTFNLPEEQKLKYLQRPVNFKRLLIACVLAAQNGGIEVKQTRESSDLKIHLKGKTREGVDDVLTIGDRRSNIRMVNSLLHTLPGIKIVSEESIPEGNDDIIELLQIDRHIHDPEYATIPDDINLNLDDLVIWIDPLDATKEYSEGLTQYVTTMVCVAKHGEPIIGVVHQPFTPETYWASKFGIDKKLIQSKFSTNHSNKSSSLKIVISRSHKGDIENWKQLKSTFKNFTFLQSAGSGYKTLQLLKGEADLYLHKTYIKKWDLCAPNALIRFGSQGGVMTTLNGDKLDYGFQADTLNRDGIFATARNDLVKYKDMLPIDSD